MFFFFQMRWEVGERIRIYRTGNFDFYATRIIGKAYKGFWTNALKFKCEITSNNGPKPINHWDGQIFYNFLKLFFAKVKRATSRKKNTHFQLNVIFQDLQRR